MTASVNVKNIDRLNLKLAMTRKHRLDHVQDMDTEDVSDWIEVANAPVGVHIYIHDERGLFAGRLVKDEDGFKAIGSRYDLKRVGLW
jgi:hypothetical protein